MSPEPDLTLVIAVYNAVRYLEFILTALRRQTKSGFEVIVADDGSGPAIAELIERMRPTLSFAVRHLWQEDSGFRKNAMLNRAIGDSRSDYLVFIDGDCVPHRKFFADHWSHRRGGTVLCGRRVNLSRQITDRLTLTDVAEGRIETLSPRLLLDGLLARSSHLEDAVRIRPGVLRWFLHRNRANIFGCNFSVEKRLLEAINGFNEEYRGPGLGEDSDVDFRLRLAGAKFYSLRNLAVLYHLYHPPTVVGQENKDIYQSVLSARDPVCRRGLRDLDAVSHPREAIRP